MALFTKVGTFFRPAADTTNTVVTGLGFRPTGVIFLSSNATSANGTNFTPMQGNICLMAPSRPGGVINAKSLAWWASDNDATPESAVSLWDGFMLHESSYFIPSVLAGGGYSNLSDYPTFDADGFTINWNSSYYDEIQGAVTYLAFGGDAQCRVSQVRTINAGSGFPAGSDFYIDWDDSEFMPDTVLVIAANPGDGVPASVSLGVASGINIDNGLQDSQWVTGMMMGGLLDPTQAARGMLQGSIINTRGQDGTEFTKAKLIRREKGRCWFRMEVNQDIVAGTSNDGVRFVYLALMGISGVDAVQGSFVKPSGAAPQVQSVAVKRAEAAFFAGIQELTFHTAVWNAINTFGVVDSAGNQGSAAHWYLGSLATSDGGSLHTNTKAYLGGHNSPPNTAQATATINSNDISLTWNPNNPRAEHVAYIAFREAGPKLEAFIGAQSLFQPARFGTPVPVSAAMRSVSTFYPQTFGTVGNIAAVTMAGTSGLAARLGMFHLLTSAMPATSGFSALGIRFDRPLVSTMATVSTFAPSKPGTPAPLAGAIMAALSGFAPRGLRIDNPLSAVMAGKLSFDSRFRISLPAVRKTQEGELPGTVNWHPNPSAERELVGWFAEGGGADISRVTEQAWDGAYAVKKVVSGSGQGIRARSFAGLEITGVNDDGTARRVNGQLRVFTSIATDVNVLNRAVYTDGSIQTGEVATYSHPGGGWQPPYFAPAVQLDSAKTLNYVEVVVQSATGAAFSLYADGAQIEEDTGFGPTHFAIGSYGHETGRWSGMPHVSMTVRQPLPMVIKGVGRGGEIVVEAFMYKATWDNQWTEDISDMVIDASVTMDTTREVTWTIDANFTYEGYSQLEENYDWIAPVMKVTYPDGTVKQRQLGLYFLVPGAMKRGEYERSVKISAFDPLWLLARQAFTGPLVAQAGVERMRVVRDILDGAVLTGGDPDTSGRRYSGPNSNKEWKKKREWPRKTERLGLANEILESSGMYPLWTIYNGEMRWRKRGEDRIKDRRPVRAWVANLPANYSLDAQIPRISSLKSEVVGAIETTPEAHDAFDEILMINDDPDTRRVRVRGRVKGHRKNRRVVRGRGDRKRVRTLYAPYVDDEATAAEIAAALADELSNRVEGVQMSVLPDPTPDYCHETVLLAIWDAYGDPVAVGQYEPTAITWNMQFSPNLNVLQKMRLHRVDNGESEIIVTVE